MHCTYKLAWNPSHLATFHLNVARTALIWLGLTMGAGSPNGGFRTPGHDELPLAEEFSWNFNLPFVKPDLGLIYCQNYPDKECFQPLSHPMSPPSPPQPLPQILRAKLNTFPQICKNFNQYAPLSGSQSAYPQSYCSFSGNSSCQQVCVYGCGDYGWCWSSQR